MSKLFIFDFDGTLFDTKKLVKQGLLDFSKENSLPLPDVDLICYGYSNPDIYDFGWGVNKGKQKELMDKAFIMISDRITNGIYIPEIFKNTKELLIALTNKGFTLSICTSREKNATIKILEYYDIKKYFKLFKTRDDIILRNKKPKPSPELIFETMEELGFGNNDTFIIGDTNADIEAGRNANVKSIGVSWGYQGKEKLIEFKSDFIIDDFLEILNLVY